MVVFTSDHGELLGSHGTLSKKEFFEESLRVPLIMRLPNKIPAGSILTSNVSGVDLAPTILDYCGIKTNEQMDGISLKEQLEGKKIDDHFIFSELKGRTCWRSNTWKVIFEDKKCVQLYNLLEDKYENNNMVFDLENKEAQRIILSCHNSNTLN